MLLLRGVGVGRIGACINDHVVVDAQLHFVIDYIQTFEQVVCRLVMIFTVVSFTIENGRKVVVSANDTGGASSIECRKIGFACSEKRTHTFFVLSGSLLILCVAACAAS